MTTAYTAYTATKAPGPIVLDTEELRRAVPSAFATGAHHRMSGRYRQIPTVEVVGLLADRGFRPVRAIESSARTEDRRGFTKHMIRFRHDQHLGLGLGLDLEIPELVLTNSHDGSSAYQFEAGIYRLICRNGLTVRSADFGSVSVRHSGREGFEKRIMDATYEVVSITPRIMEQVQGWKQIELSPPQRDAFAAAAYELKPNAAIQPEQLLRPRRQDDRAGDLWTTANVVQEHLMQGGDYGRTAKGRNTRTRPVKSVSEDLRLNRALWILTERLAQSV